MEVVKTIYSANRKHMVEFFKRSCGTFGFEANRWSDAEFEKCWVPCSPAISFSDSLETAEKEAWERIDWMIAEKNARRKLPPEA